MKAYLIDPDRQSITERTIQHDTLIADLHKLIGSNCLDHARISGEGDQVWVDDTGLMDGLTRFSISTYGNPLAGKAVVIGCDRYGEPRDPEMRLSELKEIVRF